MLKFVNKKELPN